MWGVIEEFGQLGIHPPAEPFHSKSRRRYKIYSLTPKGMVCKCQHCDSGGRCVSLRQFCDDIFIASHYEDNQHSALVTKICAVVERA